MSIGHNCEYLHVMLHELGHVIGFWHEQSRPDRDEHVTIVWKNVVRGRSVVPSPGSVSDSHY